LRPFHRNEHVILTDLNSDTGSSRNDAGTVHSDTAYRIIGPDLPNPSNDDAFIITGTATPDISEQQSRILLAEAVTNVIRHHMEQDLENRNICLNDEGTRELGQITIEAGQRIADAVQSDDQSEHQTTVDTDSSWNPTSNPSVHHSPTYSKVYPIGRSTPYLSQSEDGRSTPVHYVPSVGTYTPSPPESTSSMLHALPTPTPPSVCDWKTFMERHPGLVT
jgi:hypothetical protein